MPFNPPKTYTPPTRTPRPKLTAETAVAYLDWILRNLPALGSETETHMKAVELAIRTLATEAQGKATQHTLVEQGIIADPNA